MINNIEKKTEINCQLNKKNIEKHIKNKFQIQKKNGIKKLDQHEDLN